MWRRFSMLKYGGRVRVASQQVHLSQHELFALGVLLFVFIGIVTYAVEKTSGNMVLSLLLGVAGSCAVYALLLWNPRRR